MPDYIKYIIRLLRCVVMCSRFFLYFQCCRPLFLSFLAYFSSQCDCFLIPRLRESLFTSKEGKDKKSFSDRPASFWKKRENLESFARLVATTYGLACSVPFAVAIYAEFSLLCDRPSEGR